MHFHYSPYILPLIAAAIIAISVAIYILQRRTRASGAKALIMLALATAVWSLGYALEIAGTDLPTKIFWGKSEYLGIGTIPLAWILFAYYHSTSGKRIPLGTMVGLAIVPLLTLIFTFTTESHGLIWKDIQIDSIGAFSALKVTHGFWFWLYWIYANILLIIGTVFIFRSFDRRHGLFQQQNIVLLIAILTPWIGNILYVTGHSPILNLDITPFAFTISVFVFTFGIYRFRLVDLPPVARDLVVEKMPDGMIVLDTRGIVVDINPALQKALNISASQAIGQTARELFRAWPLLVERYEKQLEAQDEIVFGNGETQTWFELRMAPLRDTNDHLLGKVVTVREITERKRMEAVLRLSEGKYRKIYENVEDVIYETDNQGHLTSISPSIEKRGGYKPEELLGRSVTDFFVYPEQYADLDAQMIKNGSVNDFEALLQQRDGSTRYASISAHIVFDEHGQGIATEGVLRDITERKLAEERVRQLNAELEQRVGERTSELQESNAYLTSLIESSAALNESLDLNEILDRILIEAYKIVPARALNIMFVEGEYASIVRRVGYQGLEKIERNLLGFRFPIAWPTFQQMYVTHKSINISDTAQASGWQSIQSSEWVRSYIGIPLMINDQTIGFLNASHSEPNYFDEKHQGMLESLARHASIAIQNARLLDELKHALEKEQGMRDQLVQADKLAALGKMVSVIAHEINNPIQTIKNTFYLLEDQLIPGSPANDYLKMAAAEANRIADLVTQLRGTYSVGSKAMILVDIRALLLEVSDLLAPQLKNKRVEWCQAGEIQTTFIVLGVRNNLKQVFINLCLNALDAMEVLAEERKLTVGLHADQDNRRIAIGFSNNGPVIPDEALPHIFEPFFTTKKNGTGLGLSISYDIVRQHQGEIVVENMEGIGVVFTVWLPLARIDETGGEI